MVKKGARDTSNVVPGVTNPVMYALMIRVYYAMSMAVVRGRVENLPLKRSWGLAGGQTVTRYTRRYFYVCDVGPKRGKMIQQKLSFSRATESSKTRGNNVTKQGELGQDSSTTVGYSRGASVWLELIVFNW